MWRYSSRIHNHIKTNEIMEELQEHLYRQNSREFPAFVMLSI